MAFGFRRESGTGRGYVNETSSDYAIGERLSRRQYDKYIEKLGKRLHLPGVSVIRDAQRRLDEISAQLRDIDEKTIQLNERERRLADRERLLAERENETNRQSQANRRARQNAGQRRYNSLLEAFISEKRRTGDKAINKRTAAQMPEFKQIVKDVKGKPNPRNNPNIRDDNTFKRRKALDRLGGGMVFKDVYEKMYGTPIRASNFGRVNNAGRSSFTPNRNYTVRRRVA